MGRLRARVLALLFGTALGVAPAAACSGTTDSDSPAGGFGGAGGSATGGVGGTKIGDDGGWLDSPPWGGAGSGGEDAGTGGGTDGSPGGAGGSPGGGGGGAGGAGSQAGAGGTGGCGVESCNNLDDNCNGQVDEGLTQACSTSCGSGTQACKAGVWGACSALQPISCLNYASCKTEQQCVASCAAAPAESCNLADDDCDGTCDSGAGCRVGVHRSYGNAEHFYTTSASEAQCCGFTLEFQNFFYLYKAKTGALVAFHRCLLGNGKHFYTTSSSCEGSPGSTVEGVLGYIAPNAVCGSTPLYRTSHPNGEHFYTTSLTEKNNAVANLGYKDEGLAGHVWKSP